MTGNIEKTKSMQEVKKIKEGKYIMPRTCPNKDYYSHAHRSHLLISSPHSQIETTILFFYYTLYVLGHLVSTPRAFTIAITFAMA